MMAIQQDVSKPYLLFDAGGTLVFSDQFFLSAAARMHGTELAHELLFKAYYELIYTLDSQSYRGAMIFPIIRGQRVMPMRAQGYGLFGDNVDSINRTAQSPHKKKSVCVCFFLCGGWLQTLEILPGKSIVWQSFLMLTTPSTKYEKHCRKSA